MIVDLTQNASKSGSDDESGSDACIQSRQKDATVLSGNHIGDDTSP